MEVGFHEPGEGFEVDEGDRGGERGVCEECLNATSFLAMACEGTGRVKGWGGVVIKCLGTEVGEHHFERFGFGESEASAGAGEVLVFGAGGYVHLALVRDVDVD